MNDITSNFHVLIKHNYSDGHAEYTLVDRSHHYPLRLWVITCVNGKPPTGTLHRATVKNYSFTFNHLVPMPKKLTAILISLCIQYDQNKNVAKVVELNDKLRKHGIGGKIHFTSTFYNLPDDLRSKLLKKIRSFDDFDKDNDPYGQHDFAMVEIEDTKAYFKIDYHNKDDVNFGSADPSNPEITHRIMTIGLMSDY
ncbi:DUF3768 domain-containing protein [Bartonella choladocola]|uniref:Uncharacterized protein n=1 Tax=Bartonella choladocola TaxID=2750995 RepID=A0A1U9MK08_9HYPH|nr:DUF3768 domain-containing protein [Bartonella choladocola]AQT47981.1 Protein of unknown function (DUF3768) [Bartonella choladocola]